jgi:hypothetical protein
METPEGTDGSEWSCRVLAACTEHTTVISSVPVITASGGDSALFSCYTKIVAKNVTIKISEEAALWARRKAAEENSSVSRLVGEMLERQMRLSDDYWQAFEHWKSNRPLAGAGAAERFSREAVHERR